MIEYNSAIHIFKGGEKIDLKMDSSKLSELSVASWNIAAINNNPFEYWIESPDAEYDSLMKGVEKFMTDPENNVPLHEIFTDDMFGELCDEMAEQSISGLDKLSNFWKDDFRDKLTISGFLKDKTLGLKRLASMPDRITNTINLSSGETCMRPTVINAYNCGSLDSIKSWWTKWRQFMFHNAVQISHGRNKDSGEAQVVCKLLSPILRSKYPAITIEEQAISVPLQILCLAILDAILIYMVNKVSPASWEAVRGNLCEALIRNKSKKLRHILSQSYSHMDVIFIQEAAAIFVQHIRDDHEMHDRFEVLLPWNVDGKRDQNSMILVRRQRFVKSTFIDLTKTLLNDIEGTWVAPGDLVVYSVAGVDGCRFLLVSFHGDSNGLSTQPIMEVLDTFARTRFGDHLLVVGLDANTHSELPDAYHQSLRSFCSFIAEHGMQSSWGHTPDPSFHTTCSARTSLQTQFNKAVSFEQRMSRKSLKDWIVVYRHQLVEWSNVMRDNTGERRFVEGVVLPSLLFPSDHAIVLARLVFNAGPNARTEGAAASSRAAASHESERPYSDASTEAMAERRADPRKKMTFATLYDYWGIHEKPVADVSFAKIAPVNAPRPESIDEALSPDQEIRRICEDYYRRLVAFPRGENLDTSSLIFSKVDDMSIWILFSSRPVTMTLCKPWGCLFFMSMSVQYLLEFALNFLAVHHFENLRGSNFRLTVHAGDTRNLTQECRLESFGLAMNGCALAGPSHSASIFPSFVVNFTDAARFNGWFLHGVASDAMGDQRYEYSLEYSVDGYKWIGILPPPWIIKEDFFRMSAVDFSTIYWDLRPTWPWVLLWCGGMLGMVFGMLIPAIFGAMGRGRHAAIAESIAVLILSSFAFANGIYMSFVDQDRRRGCDAVLYWLIGAELLCLSWIFYTERYTVQLAAPVFSLFGITTYIFKQCHGPNPVSRISEYLPLVWTVIPSVTALSQNIARYFVKRWVFDTMVRQERSAYDAAWLDICARDRSEGALGALKGFTQRLGAAAQTRTVRQRHPTARTDPGAAVGPQPAGLRSLLPDCPEVCSLEQLFDQAAALDPFLRRLVRRLALECKGLFPVVTDGAARHELQACERILRPEGSARVAWAGLKPTDRALEKLLRSYDCDVSRLVDICRQTIAFERPGDVLACLEALCADRDLDIVRLKNRMDEDLDSRHSAGFRPAIGARKTSVVGFFCCFSQLFFLFFAFLPLKLGYHLSLPYVQHCRSIIVNLRIRSEDTRKLEIDSHICEIQLVLRQFAEIKAMLETPFAMA